MIRRSTLQLIMSITLLWPASLSAACRLNSCCMHSTARRPWTRCRTCAQVLAHRVSRAECLPCDPCVTQATCAFVRFVASSKPLLRKVVTSCPRFGFATRAIGVAQQRNESWIRCRLWWSWQESCLATSLWLLFVTWYIHAFMHAWKIRPLHTHCCAGVRGTRLFCRRFALQRLLVRVRGASAW